MFYRTSICATTDYILLVLATIWSQFLTFGIHSVTIQTVAFAVVFVALKVVILLVAGFYRVSIRRGSLDLMRTGLTVFFGDIASIFLLRAYGQPFHDISIRLICNTALWCYILLIGWRVLVRMLSEWKGRRSVKENPTALIIGAGDSGCALTRLSEEGHVPFAAVGFLDDDPAKRHLTILGRRVYGSLDEVDTYLEKTGAKMLIIAISAGISAAKMQKIAFAAKNNNAKIMIAPSMFELENHESQPTDLREINYADLLGRQLITIDRKPVADMVDGRVVMVTGAGGSIGSEICRQLRTFKPKQLLLLDIDETELHNLSLELTKYQKEFSPEVFPICCDIKNKEKIDEVFAAFKPEIVFHAAAYKHVPMMEMYPEEAIRTNIKGSKQNFVGYPESVGSA